MLMNRAKFFKTAYNVQVIEQPSSFKEEDITPIISQDEVSVTCPLNEYGLVSDVLQRALSPNLSASTRQQLLNLLDVSSVPSSSQFRSLPDDVLLNLVKLRTCQTPSEVAKYSEALNAWFEANNISDDESSDTSSSDTSSSDTSSSDTSSSDTSSSDD